MDFEKQSEFFGRKVLGRGRGYYHKHKNSNDIISGYMEFECVVLKTGTPKLNFFSFDSEFRLLCRFC